MSSSAVVPDGGLEEFVIFLDNRSRDFSDYLHEVRGQYGQKRWSIWIFAEKSHAKIELHCPKWAQNGVLMFLDNRSKDLSDSLQRSEGVIWAKKWPIWIFAKKSSLQKSMKMAQNGVCHFSG